MFKPENRDNTLLDIKMIFDGIKQIAACLAIAYGLKLIQGPMTDHGFGHAALVFINWVYVLNVVLLFAGSYAWIALSFKVKPFSRLLHWLGVIILSSFSLVILVYLILQAYRDIPFNPF